MTQRLFLLRHGEVTSHRGDVPVTEEGLQTAVEVGRRLAGRATGQPAAHVDGGLQALLGDRDVAAVRGDLAVAEQEQALGHGCLRGGDEHAGTPPREAASRRGTDRGGLSRRSSRWPLGRRPSAAAPTAW